MLPGITPALFGAGELPGNDAFTVLLLHADGANGSTQLLDYSPTAKGFASMGGTEQISTAQSKFGGASLYNNGSGYCTFPNHADWSFGSGDFTIDWWEYRTGGGCAIARDLPTTYTPFLISYGAARQIYMSSTGSSWDIKNGATGANFGTVTNNVWTHLAITRKGSTFRAFKDGVITETWTSSAAFVANSNPLCIGAAQNAQNFGGYVDELRISKGIARWTANFTPPTKAYGPDPDYSVKLLLHMDGGSNSVQFIDASSTAKGMATVRGDAKVDTTQGVFAQALKLDGVGDGLQYPQNTDWDFGSGDFTVDFRIKLNAYPTNTWSAVVARCAGGTDLNNRWWVSVHSSGFVEFDAYHTPGPVQDVVVQGGNIPLNTWKHVAVVRASNVITIYVDGVSAGSVAYSGTLPTISGPLNIGIADATGNFPVNGYIDELRIRKGVASWTANFTPPAAAYTPAGTPGVANANTKILLHMDGTEGATAFPDAASGAGSNGTHTWTSRSGYVSTVAPPKFGTGCLDAFSGGIDTPAHADFDCGSGLLTIDFWLKWQDNGDGNPKHFVNYGDFDAGTGAIRIWYDPSRFNRLYFDFSADGYNPFTTNLYFDAGNLVSSTWAHIAVTRDVSNVWRAFLNGVLQATHTTSGTIRTTTNTFSIGRKSGGVSPVYQAQGYIDEFRLTKGQALWSANFTPPTSAGVVT